MKNVITTDYCKALIASQSQCDPTNTEVGYWELEDPRHNVPGAWKRVEKKKLSYYLEESGLVNAQEFNSDLFDDLTVLPEAPPASEWSPDCVVRVFTEKDGDNVDVKVVSDPTDSVVLGLIWHCD
jgi:hypothetical protein